MNLRVKCPACGRAVEWCEASTYRPFCSQRCSLVDLGGWLKEQHAIPGDPVPGDDEELEQR